MYFSFGVQYGQMKSLLEKTKETQTVMMQRVKDALLQKDDMRIQMEEAFTTKEAVSMATILTVNVTSVVQCVCFVSSLMTKSNLCLSGSIAVYNTKCSCHYSELMKPVFKKNRGILSYDFVMKR